MSGSSSRDREPDQAALEELHRAFGRPVRSSESSEPSPDTGETEAAAPAGAADDELVIVEQEPLAATPPKIIRIDDLNGSVELRDHAEPLPPPTFDPPRRDGPADTVLIGSEDELPDAVYIEGSLDKGADRRIVFIEDDDTGDAVQPESGRDAQRGIEPRMRERRVAVRRAQSRKRLKWVALGAVVVVVVVGALALLGSPLFAVRAEQVTVTGVVYADDDRLAEIVDDLVGTPALRVDTERLERELEEIPWVDEARVRVSFPHAATIDVRERAALATYQGPDERFRVLDREGRVLDVIENYPFAYLLIEGPDPVDLEPGQFAPPGYAATAELAKNLTAAVRGRLHYADVTADGTRLVLYLDDGSSVFFGEARDLFAKLVRLETVLAENPDREPGPIDVSTDDVTL